MGGLVSLRRADGPRYYHFDGLGSTAELTDATENVTDSYRYEAFGNRTAQAGQTPNAYRYVGSLGYYADADSGLMLLGARYYAAAVGRFVTVDPVRDGGNWYGYVGNSPVCQVDPNGEVAFLVIAVIALAVYLLISGAWVSVPGAIEGGAMRNTHFRSDLYAHCTGMCIGTACSLLVPGAWICAGLKEWLDEPDDPLDWAANKVGRKCRKLVDKGVYSDCGSCCESELYSLGFRPKDQELDYVPTRPLEGFLPYHP